MAGTPRLVTGRFALVTLAGLALFVAIGATLPVLPLYVEGPLGGGKAAVGVAVGSFSFSAVLVRPLAGRMGDRLGRRPPMIVGGVIMAGSFLVYAAAPTVPLLVAARLVTGVGEALFFVAVTTLVTDLSPAARRGEALSYFSVAIYLGLGMGPVLGEGVLDLAGFTAVWVAAGCASLLAGVLALGAPNMKPELPPDGAGPRRLVHPAGVRSGTVLALGVINFIGFAAFVPLHVVDLGLDGAREFFLGYSGVVVLIRVAGARIPDRFGPGRTGTVALATLAAAGLTLGSWSAVPGLWVGTVLLGIGMALMYPALMSLAVRQAPDHQRSTVVGTVTGFFDLAQGFGGVLLGGVAALTDVEGAFVSAGLLAGIGLVTLRLWTVRAEDRAAPVG